MNLVKPIFLILTATLILSCKKKHSEPEPPARSTLPVSGKLYGKNYTIASGKANKRVDYYQEEGYEIFLSSGKNNGCETADENFHIIIRTPRKIGKFSEQYAILSDPANSDYIMFTDGNLFEITSISGNTIKGYMKVSSPTTNSNLEGVFEASICN